MARNLVNAALYVMERRALDGLVPPSGKTDLARDTLPAMLQASLGGFVASSGMVLWSIMTPLAALAMLGTRRSVPWLVAFLLVVSQFQIVNAKYLMPVFPFFYMGVAVLVRDLIARIQPLTVALLPIVLPLVLIATRTSPSSTMSAGAMVSLFCGT